MINLNELKKEDFDINLKSGFSNEDAVDSVKDCARVLDTGDYNIPKLVNIVR